MRLRWLPKVLREAGLTVVCSDGWESRGRELQAVYGVVCHHTATYPSTSDAAVVRLLRVGRSDLPGPLSQLGLARDGTYYVIAAGKANHNGYGEWGNSSIGIEAFNDGRGEPWPDVQYDAYVRGVAAICRHLGWPASKVKGHKETDPNRKIDPRGIDMGAFRKAVASSRPTPLLSLTTLSPRRQKMVILKPGDGNLYLRCEDGAIFRIVTIADADELKSKGVPEVQIDPARFAELKG